MPLPVSLPPYQACNSVWACDIHGIVKGVPLWVTTTVLGFAARTLDMRWSIPGGRCISALS
jgi:hypothetical protein